MKTLDVLVASLLVIGGLNWGLVGAFNIDAVSAIFGDSSAISRTVFLIVGACALYQAIGLKGIQDRWGVRA